MQLITIEPTPSPNSMKLHLDETLPAGVRRTYSEDNRRSAPPIIGQLLDIDGVKSVFHTADFIALDRYPNADWARILADVRDIFGQPQEESGQGEEWSAWTSFGEAQVYVQYFRGIPMQIRVQADNREERVGLSERFVKAVTEVASATLIKERKLSDYGIRYGELADIAREVEQELEAAYPEERLASLVRQAIEKAKSDEPFIEERRELTEEELAARLKDSDWRVRYAALDRMEPEASRLPLLAETLRDPQSQIRRLTVVYLGEIKTAECLPLLFEALRDASVSVRRTAGDTLSDIGDPAAIEPMIEALQDKNKLVRWRAARFLYEAGDERAVPALEEAANDSEFEVALQARMALERIRSGEEAVGTVWQQMARLREQSEAERA
ncbi:virulence factor [Paenibacillus thiaminolyticus]|uniref:Virulence factor n=1 Tax=Paenibacillus thiaminolyticus TaxID=49283 RepID=A0AAP9J182_PANTH|nr:virulence factor [Paenibacillus thiaminolyticus]MCY9537743.1 virulence factor [Paenibacillus thiaminolyticus]MCY9600300.1 virulence factor [Paenibacillus thiaminolyticus]MCY9607370.1 virulence factor [Paenibacillus thiaminolyticus]MCY9613887.1 virulence factor [Paenibacillus thiaminolyticus]MCY9617892.1 virulence factor [Paenibacillus thiaminolyticus]